MSGVSCLGVHCKSHYNRNSQFLDGLCDGQLLHGKTVGVSFSTRIGTAILLCSDSILCVRHFSQFCFIVCSKDGSLKNDAFIWTVYLRIVSSVARVTSCSKAKTMSCRHRKSTCICRCVLGDIALMFKVAILNVWNMTVLKGGWHRDCRTY